MKIACFDIGKNNFAFAVLAYTPEDGVEIECLQNKDLVTEKQEGLYMNLIYHLDNYVYEWDDCSVFLIEQQMGAKHRSNIMALKLSQHVYSYFLHRYGRTKEIIEYPAYHKTQQLGAPPKMTPYQRKKWSVDKVVEIWGRSLLDPFPKKDDVCDCILMGCAFLQQHKEKQERNK